MSKLIFKPIKDIAFTIAASQRLRKVVKHVLKHINLKKPIGLKMKGYTMYGKTIDRLLAIVLWRYNLLEGFESSLYQKLLRKDMKILDIGANLGYYSFIAHNKIGENGKIYAFEPEEDNYGLLVKNIEKNKTHNIVPIKKAVTNKTGSGKLYICEEHRGDHQVFDSGEGRDSIDIETVRIDDFVDEKIDLIKMDIQGSEFLALDGMEETLGNKDIIVLTEFWPNGIKKCGHDPRVFLERLKELGFNFHVIDEKKRRVYNSDIEGIMKICPGDKHTNLLLRRD